MAATSMTDVEERTPIQKYYSGQTIFITGALGFIGKLVVEKLLRSCSDLTTIYVLVRPKRDKEERERIAKEFSKELFSKVAKESPDYMDKIQPIAGDLALPNLGLSPPDIQRIQNEVNCIFHVAATTNFNAKLRDATNINVRATGDLMKIAKQMKHLKSFVHVSTAFAHCTRKEIHEEVHQVRLTGKSLMTVVDALDDDMLDAVTPQLLGDIPNTYVFTKAIAEELILTNRDLLPIAIVRPSIVLSTFKEPVPGWTDNIYGATGVALGVGVGVIRTMQGDKDNIADLIPADLVANQILAAGWDIGDPSLQHSPSDTKEKDLMIYNCISSADNPVTWGEFQRLLIKYGVKYGSTKIIWYYGVFNLRRNLYFHKICVFFLHTLPAYLVDIVLLLIGKKPMAVKGYRKIGTFVEVISYFAMREWKWKNTNVRKLFGKMSVEDRKMFNFDASAVNWEEELENGVIGARVNLLKDPLDTVEAGRRRLKLFKYLHYATVAFLLFLTYQFVLLVIRLAL
ncbi:fatty acyl-CoA reductase wat-like [Cylas formicarius]|uniref:fatty acyl-CoA reductase wat-like n=1 Tax=Cylas formicarius TaxID=197179 RepID=UPI00295868F5|nr:fatty acyl-CoA reductase wat-like [Cylas formicarius]XP_060533435.1 fatty acyl-CoA reductase wat-like [Cylas formicarius]XP_060533436.1 fatty acyl-CoA reductase wat-like [Cylas formicarius]